MVDQNTLVAGRSMVELIQSTLAEIADFFPLTDKDHTLVELAQNAYRTKRIRENGSRYQITMARCVEGRTYSGTQSEEEEEEAMRDPDLQFVCSWTDALEHANNSTPGPNRLVEVVTLRWKDNDDNLSIIPPNSVARQQYIQFCPGSLFIVELGGRMAKLPIEALYPWEYYARKLPHSLEHQLPEWPFRNEVSACIKNMILKVSQLYPLTDEDRALIDRATSEIRLRFHDKFWQLAAAVVTEMGNVRVGIQHDTKSGRANTDAEQAVLKKTRRHHPGEPLKTIVTAHHSTQNHSHTGSDGSPINLVTSCALCRKSILKYSPDVNAIIPLNGEGIGKVPMRAMYPLPDFPVPPVPTPPVAD